MEARARLLGHPIHQMLVTIPVGLLTVGVLIDLASLFRDVGPLMLVSFWNIAIGVVGGVVAAVFGALDWTRIPRGTRARRVATMHGAGNAIVLALFATVVGLRASEPGHALSSAALGLEIAGIALLLATGWLGAELVNRLAIGVDPGAHPDAPSSLKQPRARMRRERERHRAPSTAPTSTAPTSA